MSRSCSNRNSIALGGMTLRNASLLVSALALSAPVMASDSSSDPMFISARVAASCGLQGAPVAVSETDRRVDGTVLESCNTNRGFQVFASHRALGAGEAASIRYDGIRRDLSRSGISTIGFRAGARHGHVPVSIEASELDEALVVSFAMTPV